MLYERKDKDLTVGELKEILASIDKSHDDAIVVVNSGLLDRNVALNVNEIELTNAADLLGWPYDAHFDKEIFDVELETFKNKKVLLLDGWKIPFELSIKDSKDDTVS